MLTDGDRFEPVSSVNAREWLAAFDPVLRDIRPSLLLVTAADDRPEMAAMASGAGFRILETVVLADLRERLSRTVGVDTLLIDLRGLAVEDFRLDDAMTALVTWPAWTDARPLLIVDMPALDVVAGVPDAVFGRLLCDPSPGDIGLALCLLARECVAHPCLHDIDRDSDAARLEQLSAEVRRLAQTIDRLATDRQTRDEGGEPSMALREHVQDYASPPALAPPPATARAHRRDAGNSATRAEVRTLLRARRLRDRFLPGELFADPAWDMMLDLMAARLDGKRVSVSSLCIAAAVPPTTALRWIAQLTERGIFRRRNDPDDARRVFISLSDEAADSLASWFSAARRTGLHFAS